MISTIFTNLENNFEIFKLNVNKIKNWNKDFVKYASE